MKVFTATSKTQGQRKNDFDFVPEGELVTFGFECDGESVDDSCGCRRSLVGTLCHKGTTTFAVEDRKDLEPVTYISLLAQSLVDAGWYQTEADAQQHAAADANELLRMAAAFPVCAVIEKRGNTLKHRKSDEAIERAEAIKASLKVGDRVKTGIQGRTPKYHNRNGTLIKKNPTRAIVRLDAENGYPAVDLTLPYGLLEV